MAIKKEIPQPQKPPTTPVGGVNGASLPSTSSISESPCTPSPTAEGAHNGVGSSFKFKMDNFAVTQVDVNPSKNRLQVFRRALNLYN